MKCIVQIECSALLADESLKPTARLHAVIMQYTKKVLNMKKNENKQHQSTSLKRNDSENEFL